MTDGQGECGVPYHFRFHMPGDNATVRNQYYSFNRGNIHFAVISSETSTCPIDKLDLGERRGLGWSVR